MSFQKLRFTASGTALAFALTVGFAPAAHAAIPTPPSKVLSAALDAKTPYEAQVSCDPRPKPGVTAFAALMRARYKTGYVGTYRPCQGDTSEHYDSRAMDWMLSVNNPTQKAIANSVTAWLSAGGGVMARRFGISYIIWNHKVWKEYRPERGWTVYTGSVPHTDHVHFSFSWDGAMKRTSWWTGRANGVIDFGPCQVYRGQFAPLRTAIRTVPCPTALRVAPTSDYRVAVYGQSSSQIAVAQRRLGVKADGKFGPTTFAKVVAWQRGRVPVTGALDKATWAKLVSTPQPSTPAPPQTPAPSPAPVPPVAPWAATRYTAYKSVVLRQGSRGSAVVVLQRGLRVTPDGAFGPKTRAAVVAFQTRQRIARTGVVGHPVWDRLEKLDYPLIAYRGVTLRQGSRGAVVVVAQRALRVTADGAFGPRTGAAVKVVQLRARLARTGVVRNQTWVAIENWMKR